MEEGVRAERRGEERDREMEGRMKRPAGKMGMEMDLK